MTLTYDGTLNVIKMDKSSKAFAKVLEALVHGTDLSGQVQAHYEHLAALESISTVEQEKNSTDESLEKMEDTDEQLSTAYDFHQQQKQDAIDEYNRGDISLENNGIVKSTPTEENGKLELIQELSKPQEMMDSTIESQPNETQEKFQEFVDNGEEITENIQNDSDSLSDAEEHYQEFQDNADDLINDTTDSNSSSDLLQEFEENRLDFTEPNSTEEMYEEFSENTSDITGQTDTKSEYDESNYDLKP